MFRRCASLLTALLLPYVANGILRDRSPLPDSADLGWPQWYRDQNGLAIGLCKSQTGSPNAPGNTMCLPIVPTVDSFAGNIGDEAFYSMLTVRVDSPGITLIYAAQLEAAYASADGSPVKGTEIVFSRIRVTARVTIAGTYTVVHPYGTEVFSDVQPGKAAIKYTRDIGLATFDEALNGDMGPFPEWVNTAGTGRTNTGEVLDIFNPTAARTERFLGDPNVLHAFKGSPTGFNRVRVQGPVGMSGGTGTPGTGASAGTEVLEEALGSVVGSEWTIPIPTPFAIERAVYSRTATLFTADVFATSTPGQELIVTGPTPIGVVMSDLGNGKYHVHIESATSPTLPLSVTVYNTRSNPIISRTAPLEDIITLTAATFNRATNVLQITARSSDTSATPPRLTLVEPVVTLNAFTRDAAGLYTLSATLIASPVAPMDVIVGSSTGSSVTAPVSPSGVPMNLAGAPVAAADSFTIPDIITKVFQINVLANDVSATIPQIVILTQPGPNPLGTVSAPATPGGTITLTRDVPSRTGTATFQYILRVGTLYSSPATVTLVTAVQGATAGPAPITAADTFLTRVSTTAGPINVLANDVSPPGGAPIDPASVQVARGTGGVPAFNAATQSVTYAAPATAGTYTFTYTVASDTGVRSLPATVTVDVRAVAEILTIIRARFRNGRWVVDGTTTFFGPTAVGASVSCSWDQCPGGVIPCTPNTIPIGSGPVDAFGAWVVDVGGVSVSPTTRTLQSLTCRSAFGASITTTNVRFR